MTTRSTPSPQAQVIELAFCWAVGCSRTRSRHVAGKHLLAQDVGVTAVVGQL